jgi:hypothetical protein
MFIYDKKIKINRRNLIGPTVYVFAKTKKKIFCKNANNEKKTKDKKRPTLCILGFFDEMNSFQ